MQPITPQKRNGFWYLIRRVPRRYAALDPRGIVKLSTYIRIADDPNAIKAAPIAAQLSRDLEEGWIALANGEKPKARKRYDDAVKDALGIGFNYATTDELMTRPVEELVKRFKAIVLRRSGNMPEEVTAVLGGEDKPAIRTSEMLTEYEDLSRAYLSQMGPDQEQRWRTERARWVANVKAVIGDKPLGEVTREDALKYRRWLLDRITRGKVVIKTANKEIGGVSRMFNKISDAKALGFSPVFAKLRIEGQEETQRPAYDAEFIQARILAPGMFDDLYEEARRSIYVMIETGLRPSEIANLTAKTIHLNHAVPYVEVEAEDRVLKTAPSKRKIPLVGVSLAAMRLQPRGFLRYRHDAHRLSTHVNRALASRGLRPTEKHTFYSVRHSFEDRLTELKTMPDKIQAYLMGHKYSRPKYGSDPRLDHLAEWLNKIAFPRWPDAL